jgi:hypothetical protein
MGLRPRFKTHSCEKFYVDFQRIEKAPIGAFKFIVRITKGN